MALITIDDLKQHLRLAISPAQVFAAARVSAIYQLAGLTYALSIANSGAYDVYFKFGKGVDVTATTVADAFNLRIQPGQIAAVTVPGDADRIAFITAPSSGLDASDPATSSVVISSDVEDQLLGAKIATAEALVANFVGSSDLATDFNPMPAPVLEAIREWASVLYENREGAQGMPAGIGELLTPYRLTWTFG